MKKVFIIVVAVFCITFAATAQKSEVFITKGNAIKGYDPVAFFTESKAVKGSKVYAYKWKEATWLFSTKDNLNAFKENPEKYAPQYGGYCAYGTAENHKAPTETDTWTITNDKLYFNYNADVKKEWTKQQDALIKKADKNWISIKDKE